MRTVPVLAAGALLIAACGTDDALQQSAETRAPETTVTDPPTTPEPSPAPDAEPGSTSEVEQPTPSDPTTTPVTTPPTVSPSTGTAAELAAVAIDDLMGRLGVERGEIGVRSVEEVTWRDGSIGCPDPDFAYTQALVPGIRVVLDHDGFAYHYHQGGGRGLFYCPTPAAPLETAALD